jgi:hypothetical protein
MYIITDQQGKSQLDGTVGFADFEKQTYTIVRYQNNLPLGFYTVKDSASFFKNAFINNDNGTNRKQINGCYEQTSIIKLPDGRDSITTVSKKVDMMCTTPAGAAIWQSLQDFLAWQAVLNFLNSFTGNGANVGGSTGNSSFYNSSYGTLNFSAFGTGAASASSQWNSYDPYSQQTIQNYANSLGNYWEDPSYDNDTYLPYDPNIDGPIDAQGYRKIGGEFQYVGGAAQNYINDNTHEKYAVFTKANGEKVYFPGATITDFGVLDRAGVTTANGGIHMSTIQNGLEDLQHEYGHYLQAKALGVVAYYTQVVPASLFSATVNPSQHRFLWTEVEANDLSSAFFGPNSAIAQSTYYPK